MIKSIIRMLISDSLEINNLKTQSEFIDVLTEYATSEEYKVLYVLEGYIHLESSVMKDINEKLVIGKDRIDKFIEKDFQLPFVKTIVESDDIMHLSMTNGIPLSRLTGDYESLFSLNKSYRLKLNKIFEELNPIVKFITENKIASIVENKESSYHNIIREFIENELKPQ